MAPESRRPAPRRRWLFALTAAGLGVLAALSAGELYVRFFPPLPPSQVVRHHNLKLVDGVPVWSVPGIESIRHFKCAEEHPERQVVMFFGDSITAGTFLEPKDVFTEELERRLNEARPSPGFCVMNLGEPGYHFDQKLATLKSLIPRYHPALVMWQISVSEQYPYSLLGSAAFSLESMELGPDGFPEMPGVPAFVNRPLFLHSRLYQYVVMSVAAERRLHNFDYTRAQQAFFKKFEQLFPYVRSTGAHLVVYMAPPLDRPFRELLGVDDMSREAPTPVNWQRPYLKLAQAAGVPAYMLQNELINEDYMTIRYDPCCHYNVAGQQALARVFERIVLKEIDRRP